MPTRATSAGNAANSPTGGNPPQPSPAVRPHSTRRASTAASAALSAAAAKAALIAPGAGGGFTTDDGGGGGRGAADGGDTTVDEFRPGPVAAAATTKKKRAAAATGTLSGPGGGGGAAPAGKVQLKAEEADWGRQLAAKAAARMQEMKRQSLDGASPAPVRAIPGNASPAADGDKVGGKAPKAAKKDKKGKGKAAVVDPVSSAFLCLLDRNRKRNLNHRLTLLNL